MAHVVDHLSIADLEQRYRTCGDACSARHYQTIWLLARGHTVPEVSALTSFVPRWIEELQARYNALGPSALGDLRRNNGMRPSVLKPEVLAKLKVRLKEPPADGGVWTSRKVADFMADQLGLARVHGHVPIEPANGIEHAIHVVDTITLNHDRVAILDLIIGHG